MLTKKDLRVHGFPRCIEVCKDELRPKNELDIEVIKVTCHGCPYFELKGSWSGRDEKELVVTKVKGEKKILDLKVEFV